jgi:DNA-binding transcriptional ArsR family regulator
VTPRKKKDELQPVLLKEPRDIRALAHPARLAVIEELYAGGEMTATECAAIVGLSPSAMSYHLRQLEKAGIVVRAESGDGRERPWRAAGSYLKVESTNGVGQLAASAALNETILGRTLEEFRKYEAARGGETPEWRKSGGASNGQVWLLPEEAQALQQRLLDELEGFRGRRTGERPDGARRVRVALLVFPIV